MKKLAVIGICFLFTMLSLIPSINSDEPVFATTLYVGGSGTGNYTTIQSAINDSNSGDTVFVYNGTYFEIIDIDKSIHLIGEDKNSTSIIFEEKEKIDFYYTIKVIADYVNISGFTLKNYEGGESTVYVKSNNNSITNNKIISSYGCVKLLGSNNNLVTKNTIHSYQNRESLIIRNSYNNVIRKNDFYKGGIRIFDNAYDNVIINNSINNNTLVYLMNESNYTISNAGQVILVNCDNVTIINQNLSKTNMGVQLFYSNNCSINNNTIYDNIKGIYCYKGNNNKFEGNKILYYLNYGIDLDYSENNIISGNYITVYDENLYQNVGISLDYSSNNSIFLNKVYNNYIGINLHWGSNHNIVYHNTLVNNSAFNQNTNGQDVGEGNQWNLSFPYSGNYWGDYNGIDEDGDGIGDTPYDLCCVFGEDNYPLMNPITNPPFFVWIDDEFNSSIPGWDHTHFNHIQDGINAVADNGTVFVYNGTYYENVIVNKTIDLMGEDTNNTIIDGSESGIGPLVIIRSDYVKIDSFSILNGNNDGLVVLSNNTIISNNNISFYSIPSSALCLLGSKSVITNNIFYHNGISLCILDYGHVIDNNMITDNIFSGIGFGIWSLSFSRNDTISNNYFDTSIIFYGLDDGCANITIANNTILVPAFGECNLAINGTSNHIINNTVTGYNDSNSEIGIFVGGSNNSVSLNTITYCDIGIEMNGFNNSLYYNNFLNNIINAIDENNNTWYNTSTLMGNYWDDYTGIDADSNGIGDTPYNISEGDNQDLYPLMEPINFELPTPNNVYVDDDFNESVFGWQYDHFNIIQDGIDIVDENGTVYVFNGTYYENLIINKTLTLLGEYRNTTIIEPSISDNIISVYSNNVRISNFCIQNSGSMTNAIKIYSNFNNISNNLIFNNRGGIEVFDDTRYNIIRNNDFTSNIDCGINLLFTDFNTIIGNRFLASSQSIITDAACNNSFINNYFSGSSVGLFVYFHSNNNTIIGNQFLHSNNDGLIIQDHCDNIFVSDNLFYKNDHQGIKCDEATNIIIKDNIFYKNKLPGIFFGLTHYSIIDNNTIYENKEHGILFDRSTNNVIVNNTIMNNSIGFEYSIYSCLYNTVYHNNFIGNLVQAIDNMNNNWDNGYPSGGNYWDDYTGTDNNGDGIGETPYDIAGENQDLYPFIEEDGWLKSNDVNQGVFDRGFPIRHAADGDWGAAQSFSPVLNTITRVEIYLRIMGTAEFNLTIELRENHPQGTLVDTVSFTPDEVPVSWEWFSIDFDDIVVTPDTVYYIVIPSPPDYLTPSFGYEWRYAFGNQYDDGAFWFTRDGGGLWRDLPTMYEFCFRTYGYS